MSNETCKDGILKMPFGSTISIHYNKDGTMTQTPVSLSSKPHHYLAIFEKADVQFVIKIDNTSCKDRKMGTELELLNKCRGFVVDRGESEQLETFESLGGKFHIYGQYSTNGEVLISLAALKSDITYDEASIKSSQIKFTVRYSKSFNTTFKIFVKYLGKRYGVNVTKSNTLAELKDKIEAMLKFIPFALSFKSVILMGDTTTLDYFGICENDEIYIPRPTDIKVMNFANKTGIGKHPHKQFQIWLAEYSSATIDDLKFMIDVEEGISVGDQVLKINSKSNSEGEDLTNLSSYNLEKDDVITIFSRKFGGGGAVFGSCYKCNWNHYSYEKCISEDEYYARIHQKGIVCFNKENSEQEFSPTTFIEDQSVAVISFIIEMRLMGPCYPV